MPIFGTFSRERHTITPTNAGCQPEIARLLIRVWSYKKRKYFFFVHTHCSIQNMNDLINDGAGKLIYLSYLYIRSLSALCTRTETFPHRTSKLSKVIRRSRLELVRGWKVNKRRQTFTFMAVLAVPKLLLTCTGMQIATNENLQGPPLKRRKRIREGVFSNRPVLAIWAWLSPIVFFCPWFKVFF